MIKWFIGCLIVIFFGLGLLIGMVTGVSIHFVDTELTEIGRANLLILYDINWED